MKARPAKQSGKWLSIFAICVLGLHIWFSAGISAVAVRLKHTQQADTQSDRRQQVVHGPQAAPSTALEPVPAPSTTNSTATNATECLLQSGFDWVLMNATSQPWEVMSTVEAHPQPSGLQARCDMVIGSRYTKFHPPAARQAWVRSWAPRTVFVRNDLLPKFVERVMPCLTQPLVLLLGDSDLTLPKQVDLRFRPILPAGVWEQLLQDERVLHMFVENLDTAGHPKLSGLPLGVSPYNYPDKQADFILRHLEEVPPPAPLGERPLQAMHVARMRDGKGQWADRQHVQELCIGQWSEFCVSPGNMNSTAMWEATQQVPFVVCVHGGGLDPSPKAWEALLLGSIPIVAHFSGDDAYRHLPVVFVDGWHSSSLSLAAMEGWRRQLGPWFAEPGKRAEVLRRLGSQFWWDKVTAAVEGRLQGFMADNPDKSIEGVSEGAVQHSEALLPAESVV